MRENEVIVSLSNNKQGEGRETTTSKRLFWSGVNFNREAEDKYDQFANQ
jgi:hypothetical protein